MKAKGYTIAMATSASAEDVEFNLNNADIQHYFEAIISDEMITHGKPAPDVYLKTAQQLNLSPQECLCSGGQPKRCSGSVWCRYHSGYDSDKVQPTKEIKAMCNYILKSLDDLKEIV